MTDAETSRGVKNRDPTCHQTELNLDFALEVLQKYGDKLRKESVWLV